MKLDGGYFEPQRKLELPMVKARERMLLDERSKCIPKSMLVAVSLGATWPLLTDPSGQFIPERVHTRYLRPSPTQPPRNVHEKPWGSCGGNAFRRGDTLSLMPSPPHVPRSPSSLFPTKGKRGQWWVPVRTFLLPL